MEVLLGTLERFEVVLGGLARLAGLDELVAEALELLDLLLCLGTSLDGGFRLDEPFVFGRVGDGCAEVTCDRFGVGPRRGIDVRLDIRFGAHHRSVGS